MPISSTYPDIKIRETDLCSFLFNRKDRTFSDDKVIFIDSEQPEKRRYTYHDCRHLSQQLGSALSYHYSMQATDVIAIFAPNDVDFPIVTLAALSLGAVISPANPGYTTAELAYQLRDSTAKLIFAHYSALSTVKAACKDLGIPASQILLLGADHDPAGEVKHWTDLFPVPTSYAPPKAPRINAKNDLAFLVYSSGTTGRPKGVMLTHYNLVSNILQINAGSQLSHDGTKTAPNIPDAPRPAGDTILSLLPFFHIYGLNTLVLNPLYSGVGTIILSKFNIERFCQLVQQYRITFVFIVPPIALLLAKHPCVDQYDLSSIRITNSGAAPLTRELQEAVFRRCGVRIKQGYGLSETSPTTHEQRFEDWDRKSGSIGRLLPNLQVRIHEVGAELEVDDKGTATTNSKELAAGEVGELYMKGPNIFKGYWHNEQATRECLSTDGWFRTGDVGYVDADGNFWITDRVKELIKYKGFQVPPAELEGYLVEHELVDDVVVVGVISEELGTEIPRAYVVRKGGLASVREGDEERIVQWLNAKVANHKKLRGGVKFVESVPKSASGKLLRRMLKDRARKEYAEEEKMRKKLKAKV